MPIIYEQPSPSISELSNLEYTPTQPLSNILNHTKMNSFETSTSGLHGHSPSLLPTFSCTPRPRTNPLARILFHSLPYQSILWEGSITRSNRLELRCATSHAVEGVRFELSRSDNGDQPTTRRHTVDVLGDLGQEERKDASYNARN